jgi:NADH-quinone oxidoreductase subunit M
MFEFLLHLGSILTAAYALKILWIIIFKDLKESNFNLKTKTNYQPTIIENFSILLPAIFLIILSITTDKYLGRQFDFHYLTGFFTTFVYLIIAYLIRFPIMSRIDH